MPVPVALPGGTWPVLAAILGVLAALWLRRRSYRQPRELPLRAPSPWSVPALAVVGTLLARFSWSGQPPVVLATYVLALVWALTLVLVNLEVLRLPNALVLPAYPAAAVLLGACSVVTGDGWALLRALACAGGAVVVHLALGLTPPGGLGLGAVKLAGVLAALLGWFGWYPALLGLAAEFVLMFLAAWALLLLRRAGRDSHLPVGPYLVLGTYLCGLLAPLL